MKTITPTRRAAIAGAAAVAIAARFRPAIAAESLYDDSQFESRCRSLIPGDTLAGWEGEGYWFRREDVQGDPVVVAGRLERKIPGNRFLCTIEPFADFDLRWSARLIGAGDNAGVQFRSRRPKSTDDVPRHEMIGYQCDIGRAWGRSVWGGIYDESRRRRMLAEPESAVEVAPVVAEDSPAMTRWVDMRLVALGTRVQTYVDGQMVVDYTEEDAGIAAQGVIGLQIHGGPPAECWYRNVRVLPISG